METGTIRLLAANGTNGGSRRYPVCANGGPGRKGLDSLLVSILNASGLKCMAFPVLFFASLCKLHNNWHCFGSISSSQK